jgi:hypothetical protein
MSIYSTNKDFDSFHFDSIVLTKPGPIDNGNYFIKFLINNNNLYTQPPKCVTRNGIINVGKKWYIDLMFTNVDESFIQWVENLETHCVKHIYNNRSKWFDSEMELHDIENYFSTPMKVYKSGKYYILRVNIANHLGKPAIKIFNENQEEQTFDSVKESQQVMSVIEFKGIKCSARSFQIDIELKQLMTLAPSNLFDNCVFNIDKTTTTSVANETKEEDILEPLEKVETDIIDSDNKESLEISTNDEAINIQNDNKETINKGDPEIDETSFNVIKYNEPVLENANDSIEEHTENKEIADDLGVSEEKEENSIEISENVEEASEEKINIDTIDITPTTNAEFEEVNFDLEELPQEDNIVLKNRKDVYYEMYREARRKAKIAKEMAMASYLEAKNIKNTYMLDDIEDSDDSDIEMSDME